MLRGSRFIRTTFICVEVESMGRGKWFAVDRLREFEWTPMAAEGVKHLQKSIETFKKASESSSESPED